MIFYIQLLYKYDIIIYKSINILGDFNICVCCPSKTAVTDFMDTLESFNPTQAIQEPTYSKGHTVDLIS